MNRWLALGLSSFVSLIAFGFFLEWRSVRAEDVTFVESDVEEALAARSNSSAASENTSARVEQEPWLDFAFHVPREAARKLFPQIRSRAIRYDPWCGYVYGPHKVTGKDFAEHPDGKYEKRANSLGIRSEREPREIEPDLRILIAGDSHVDGVCYPSEGYPALLEARLARTLGEDGVEVLNAAHGGYTLYHYLGTLERFLHLDLQPDLFVVTVFVGNDFSELLGLTRYFAPDQRRVRARVPGYDLIKEKVREAEGSIRSAFAQGLSAAAYFAAWPAELEAAVREADDVLGHAKARCDERGIDLLVVLLPAPVELIDQADRELIESTMQHAGLGAEDLAPMRRLRESFASAVRERGIRVLDLYPRFARHAGQLFWSQDLHINLAGHALTAELVEAEVLRLLDDSPSGGR